MSITLNVYLERSRLPSCTDWSGTISREGFPLYFPTTVNLAKHTGYLPVMHQDEESGFEFSVFPLEKDDYLPPEVTAAVPAVDSFASFRFFEMEECQAAAIAAAVLAKMTGGIFEDPQSGSLLSAAEALSEARNMLAAAKGDAAKQPPKLSTKEWAVAFEKTMQQVNSEYRLSNDFRGKLVECLREDATEMWISQNCVKLHDSYRHCFALLFTKAKLSGALNSPFVLGSRFDHNSTIARAYNSDYRAGQKWKVAPQEWHSEYRATIRGTKQWVESTARSAEQFLLPVYLSRLAHGATQLIGLFQDAALFIEKWSVTEAELRRPVENNHVAQAFAHEFRLDDSPGNWTDDLIPFANAYRLADTNGISAVELLKYRWKSINTSCNDILLCSEKYLEIPAEVRNAAIFVSYVLDFLAVRTELPKFEATIRRIEQMFPKHESPSTAAKPWWKIW